jgi:acetate kinase
MSSRTQSDERRIDAPNHVACVPLLVELLEKKTGVSAVSAIGHRVVHGGPRYCYPLRVDGAMLEELRRISSFAPNHLPSTIALLEVVAAKFPQVPTNRNWLFQAAERVARQRRSGQGKSWSNTGWE